MVDGYERRIFCGDEFSELGFFEKDGRQFFCCDRNACGKNSIKIIDGGRDKKVIEPYSENSNTNYALPKMDFAKKVLAKEKPFDRVNFDGFIPLFEVLKDILNIDVDNKNKAT